MCLCHHDDLRSYCTFVLISIVVVVLLCVSVEVLCYGPAMNISLPSPLQAPCVCSLLDYTCLAQLKSNHLRPKQNMWRDQKSSIWIKKKSWHIHLSNSCDLLMRRGSQPQRYSITSISWCFIWIMRPEKDTSMCMNSRGPSCAVAVLWAMPCCCWSTACSACCRCWELHCCVLTQADTSGPAVHLLSHLDKQQERGRGHRGKKIGPKTGREKELSLDLGWNRTMIL